MTAAATTPLALQAGAVQAAGGPVLQLAAGWSAVSDAEGHGLFLQFQPAEQAAYLEQALGTVPGLQCFTSLHRVSPFWVQPAVGTASSQVRPDTLWLLLRASAPGQRHVLVVPLLDAHSRYALRGAADGLAVTAETGDAALACSGGTAVFIAAGDDPYALLAAAARSVQRHLAPLGACQLRADKPQPDFIDLFGWCTWDAFYKDVSADKVLAGLASFQQAGVQPRLLILDDGWQRWQRADSGEDRLVSLDANACFGGDLSALADAVKTRFGVQRLLVWHALLGYWGGLDDEAFAHLGTRSVARSFGPGLLANEPRWNVWPWGAQVGVPARDSFATFYDALHATLASQGVDGVKVDVQALLEAVSAGQGGRVAMARAARRALEASVDRHFGGRLINCMSCTQECVYLSGSSLLRSSDDFFPRRPDSHGRHLHVNAVAGLWFGAFMQCDWDMFHSDHAHGAFHAAARAISGGPVYVSDGIGAHDAALLRKLVLSDGSVLRADLPARPTPDTLFTDPTVEPALLKIFNRNGDCAVVGLFHAGQGNDMRSGSTGPADVPDLQAAAGCIAWAHQRDELWHCSHDAAPSITLAAGGWELVSMAPIEHGFAALGLRDKFNSGGAITARRWHGLQCALTLRDGGDFLAWAAAPPDALLCDGTALPFSHDAATGRLQAALPTGGQRTLAVCWAGA